MASVKRMTDLAHQISEKTKVITDYLSSRGLEAASFDVEGLIDFPFSPQDEEVCNARSDLIGLTKELHDTAKGPREALRTLAWDVSTLVPASEDRRLLARGRQVTRCEPVAHSEYPLSS